MNERARVEGGAKRAHSMTSRSFNAHWNSRQRLGVRALRAAFVWSFAFAIALPILSPALFASDRLRVIVETDAGGDPDDEQSMVRFLLYVNEWDVEGIIANRAKARDGENWNKERTGLGIVRQLVKAYGACFTNLVQHDARYPKPAELLARTVAGYDDTDDGVNLIMRAIDSSDPRPLWYMDWGSDAGSGTNNMKRALARVLRERGEDGYAKFKSRIRLICTDKLLPEDTAHPPPWTFWITTWQPPMDGKRWYHRFSANTSSAGGFNVVRDVLTGHGPLGALYPTNTTHWLKEGDSMSFLYVVPTGMNDPMQPTWGGWAGRYGLQQNAEGRPYYWANQFDAWGNSTNRDNTLRRWAKHLQNDFRARLNWCVKPFKEANHPPRLSLNGQNENGIAMINCEPGERIRLDATGSTDPDDNAIDYDWFVYPEAGTYRGYAEVEALNAPRARFIVPEDAGGKIIHIILSATDSGEPPLTRYRRAVLNVIPKSK
jgi:hypothetical protein